MAEQNKSKTNPSLAGSVFINNTSYSGADIKVVVHVYNQGSLDEFRKEQEADLANNQRDISTLRGNITNLENRLASAKLGTQERLRLTGQLVKARADLADYESIVPAQEKKIKDLKDGVPAVQTKVLAEVQTLSVSIFREKMAVRSCGSVYPKAFTRGPREIAGSLIFTVFDKHVLYEFLEAHPTDFDAVQYTSAIMDQLPPVDITVAFANEYGSISRMTILGVEFMAEGQVMSIEDLMTENTVQFVARDIDPMRSVARRDVDQVSNQLKDSMSIRASQLILEEDYQAIKQKLSPFERFRRRRNPFL